MFHAAGILFGGFWLYTGLYQQACEEAVLLIGLLGMCRATSTERTMPFSFWSTSTASR